MADPLAIVRVALSTASITIQVTDECVKGYKYFTEASRMPADCRYLRVRLQIEQQRFLSFASEAGLLSVDTTLFDSLQVHSTLFGKTLTEIKLLFETFQKANGKYVDLGYTDKALQADPPEPQPNIMDTLCKTQEAVAEMGQSMTHDKKRTPLLSRVESLRNRAAEKAIALRTIMLEPRRLVWASVDRGSFEELIRKLADLNSFLIALLDRSSSANLSRVINTSYLEILQLRNDVQGLKDLIQASDEASKPANLTKHPIDCVSDQFLAAATEAEIRSNGERMEHLRELAHVKVHKLSVYSLGRDQAHTGVCHPGLSLDLSHLVRTLDVDRRELHWRDRQLSPWAGRRVWTEWLDYPSRELKHPEAVELAEARLLHLTNLLRERLPRGFRSPPCAGYTKSTTNDGTPAFGLVFEEPPGVESSAGVLNLRQLLQMRPKPSLTARVSLCYNLAECVAHFHAVDWLHKGFRSESVLFFGHETIPNHLDRFYVTGFELSRPEYNEDMTEEPPFNAYQDIYRHPLSQDGASYRKSYDMYSFGIILLEVAYWGPIEDILGFKCLAETKPADIRGVQRQLLGKTGDPVQRDSAASSQMVGDASPCLEKVADKCGDVYKDIVLLCLRADSIEKPAYSGEQASTRKQRLRVVFEEQIIGRLRTMKIALET